MPRQINLSARNIAPGSYSHEIDTPTRSSSATVTMTRPVDWPDGEVFTYRIFERERNGELKLLAGATESGGHVVGKDGTENPPLRINLSWPEDRDKDVIRFELDVVQTFRTAISIAFN